jgi:hypothetical protein
MITYKNISYSAKTFYGVEFRPGEVKSVPGYINDSGMVRVFTVQKPKAPTVIIEPVPRKKKKSTEPEKVEVAETQENKIETSEEETSNGNN